MTYWLDGEYHGNRIHYALGDAVCTVGRGSGSDLVLPSQTVSRHHAELRLENEGVVVTDLGSLNGTRINGQPVPKTQAAQPGDVIEFGSVVLRLSDGESSTSAPLYITEESVSKSFQLTREDTGQSSGGLAGQEPLLLRLLTEAGELLVLPGTAEATFDQLLKLVENTIPANRIIILLQNEGNGEPVQRAARFRGDRAIAPLRISRTMVRMVMEDGTSLLTGDAQEDERFRNQQSIVAQELHSAMAVPLVHAEDTLGLLYVDTDDPLTVYGEHDLRVLTLLGQMLGAKIANARLLEVARERERLREEMKTAASIQRRLLPQKLPDIPGFELLAHLDTSEAVGGDLYDAGVIGENRFQRYQVVLGDVSGKGIGAALLMSDVLATIRALRGVLPPRDLVRQLNAHLLQSTEPEHYVTLFLGELDGVTHRFDYVNGGHPDAFLIHPSGEFERLGSTGPPPGLVDLPELDFTAGSVDFPPGATLVVYSDGVSEAERGDEMFGDDRLAELLTETVGQCAEECARRILDAIQDFLGDDPPADDTTLLILRRKP